MIKVYNADEHAEQNQNNVFVGTSALAKLLNDYAKATTTLIDLPFAIRSDFEPLGYIVESEEWQMPDDWVR